MRGPTRATPSLITSMALTLALTAGCGGGSDGYEDGFYMAHVGVDPDGLIIAGVLADPEDDIWGDHLVILRSPDGETWTTETIPDAGRLQGMVVGPDTVVVTTQTQTQNPRSFHSHFWVSQGGAPFVHSQPLDWDWITGLAYTGGEYVAASFDIGTIEVAVATSADLVDWQIEEPGVAMWNPRLFVAPGGDLWAYGEGQAASRRPVGGEWEIVEHGLSVVAAMGHVAGQIVGVGWDDNCYGEDPSCIHHESFAWDGERLESTPIDRPEHVAVDLIQVDATTALQVGQSIVRITGDFATGTHDTVWSSSPRSSVYAITRFGDAFIAVGEVVLRSDDAGRTWRELDIPAVEALAPADNP